MKLILLLFLILNLINYSVCLNNQNIEPRGIRLSLPKSGNSIRVTWWTEGKMISPVVLYNTELFTPEKDSSFGVKADVQKFDKSGFIGHPTTALIQDLEESTTYYYCVGDKAQGVYSKVFNFTTGLINPQRSNQFRPFKSIFFGDMGHGDSYTTVDNIISRMDNDLSFIVHVGDIAYADIKSGGFLDGNQTIYNLFLDAIEPISSQRPYLVCPGNHDVFYDQSFYRRIWQMPSDKDKDWYSFDYNGVHFISFSSEHDWLEGSSQHKWIEKELKHYRESNPDGWLIVYSHRPFYCSAKWKWCSSDDKKAKDKMKKPFVKALEKLLYKYNVNLYIGGHSHSVEYTKPVYKNQVLGDYENPKATVHITVGTGGNVGKLLEWYNLPTWANEFRSSNNGFGVLNFVNETHLNWQFISNENNNKVIDEFYLAKNRFN